MNGLVKHVLSALLLLGALGTAFPQETQPLSLEAALQYAVDHSTAVKKARLEAQRGDQYVKEIFGTGLPQISANAQFNYNPTLQVIFFPDFLNGRPEEVSPVTIGTHWGTSASLEVTQLAYSPAFNVGLRAARTSAEFYDLLIEKSKDEILLDVAKLYYGVQALDEQLALVQANLDQVKSLLKLAQLQLDNGLGRRIDVDQLRVNQMNLENQLRNIDLERERQLNLLKFAMQMPLETNVQLVDTLSENQYTVPDLVMVNPSFLNRIDFAVLDKQQELNELNLARYRAENLPTVSLFGNLNAQAQPRTFGDFAESQSWADYSSIGLRVRVPIFDGFQRRARMEQVKIDMQVTAENRRYTEQAMNLQYTNARNNLRVNLNNLQTLNEGRRMAEEVYRVAQNRFREGIAPITEVVTAETAMRESQANYIAALYQVKLAELDLLQVNGELLKMVN